MKIILAIFSRNDRVLGVSEVLKKMGNQVMVVYTDDYSCNCSYLERKVDELGISYLRNKYARKWVNNVYNMITENKADILLFVNLPVELIFPEELEKLHNKIKIKCWFVDTVCDHPECIPYYKHIDGIYVFEERDVLFLNNMEVSNIQYVPVGHNMNYHKIHIQSDKSDIVFIGSPFKNRLQILEVVAIQAVKKKWKLRIVGPFYEKKYFWKRFVFEYKYPNIKKFLKNGSVSADEANKIYNNSKICLNIHDTKHKSLNLRSFDILAAGAFELVDKRNGYIGAIQPDKALVEFTDLDDLLRKIEHYLINDEEREKIAIYGYDHNIYSMEYSLKQVLK